MQDLQIEMEKVKEEEAFLSSEATYSNKCQTNRPIEDSFNDKSASRTAHFRNLLKKASATASVLLLATSLSAEIGGNRATSAKGMTSFPTMHTTKTSARNEPDWSLQSGVSLRKDCNKITWIVHTVKRESDDGYGYAAGANFVTNNRFVGQFYVAYDWPLQNGAIVKNFDLIIIGFNPKKEPFLLVSGENNERIRKFDSTIKSGQDIEMTAELLRKGIIYISAWNMQTGNMIAFRIFMKGAKKFIGHNGPFSPLGMTTGPMIEERHLNPYERTHGSPIRIMMYKKSGPGVLYTTEFNGVEDKLKCDSSSDCDVNQDYKEENGMRIFTFGRLRK